MATNVSASRDDNFEMGLVVADRNNPKNPVLLYGDPDTNSLFVTVVSIENVQNATTPIYANSLNVKTSPGRLKGLTGYNSKASAQFIQIHDASSLPADSAIPKIILTVPTVANFSFDFGTIGRYFTAGIIVCNSSTGPTKTIGSADCWFDVQYV